MICHMCRRGIKRLNELKGYRHLVAVEYDRSAIEAAALKRRERPEPPESWWVCAACMERIRGFIREEVKREMRDVPADDHARNRPVADGDADGHKDADVAPGAVQRVHEPGFGLDLPTREGDGE